MTKLQLYEYAVWCKPDEDDNEPDVHCDASPQLIMATSLSDAKRRAERAIGEVESLEHASRLVVEVRAFSRD